MAWQRGGDTGAHYPKLMAVRGDRKADHRTINEVAGFVWRLSLQSGAHLTDYVLDLGTIEMIGGQNAPELVRLCVKFGLLTKVNTGHGLAYKLVVDPDFIHLRPREEVEWERQQRNDGRDLALIVPVRRRDGDQCRWCGIGVIWRGRKTARSGEVDHLHPGEPGTVDTCVVSCRRCNRARGGDVARWDSEHVLRLAPGRPRYGQWTAELLTENGYPTEPTGDDERPAPVLGADTAPTRVRPATGMAAGSAPAPAPTESPPKVAEKSLSRSIRTTPAGSGRVGDGSGSAGSGSGVVGRGVGLSGSSPGVRRRGRRAGRRSGGGG